MSSRSLPWFSLCRFANGLILAAIGLLCFLAPVATTVNDLRDPGLRSAEIPQAAWRLHRSLTPRYEAWARQRLTTSRAAALSLTNISGTEWPLFGSVFYLWSTEALQAAWEWDAKLCPTAPKVYARTAIDAALHLVIDPSQAAWVKTHWGSNYLKTENVFYRMLVMAALVTHARLTDDKQYLPMLRDQVESFAAELDASPHGLLDDYPGECYPVDVLAALAMIHEADSVLGTDHSAFLQRARRGFAPKYLDEQGLIPYRVDSKTGRIMINSRGCGNSDVPIVGALLWPDLAKDWYAGYVKHFWQEVFMGAGFRELPMGTEIPDGYLNVDSGPVLRGYGFAASAFGVGAARSQGHFEHAYPMSTELLAFSYPLLDGTLYLPRKCSDAG